MTGAEPASPWFREWAERTGHVFFVIRVEVALTLEFVSESVVELTGHTAAELLADPHLLEHHVVPEQAKSRAAAGVDEAGRLDVELDLHHRDGTTVRVHVVASRRAGGDGAMVFEGVVYDIREQHAARQRADQSEAWFRLSFEKSLIGMCVVAPGGRFLRCNPALCQMLGRDNDELSTMTWQEVTHPADLQVDLDLVAAVLAGESTGFRLLKRFVSKDGAIIWGDLTTAVLNDADGRESLWISQVVDVTAKVEAEQALAASEQQYRLLAENVSDVVVQLDRGIVRWVSPSLTRSLGWEPDDWIGRSVSDFHHPDDAERVRALDASLGVGQPVIARVRVRAKDGTYHWVSGHAAAYHSPTAGEAETVVSIRLIDDDVAREQELDRRATYDELTGLLSRRALFDAFAGLQRRAQGADEPPVLAALFCDLDNFKDINDTHGHAVGDAVLRSLAERILGVVRRGDLAARMGGDEFLIVLLDSTDPTDAEAIAQRIRAALAEPVAIPGGRVTVTASIGITTIRPGESADALIARADEAMYAAKRAGRNTFVRVD